MPYVSFLPAGRAGNFFFTCAAAWAYAKRHGFDFSVPKYTTSEFWSPLYLPHLQNPEYNDQQPRVIVREKHFHYAPIEFSEGWRGNNIVLSGYFQSYKYFNEYRDEMLDAFALPWHHIPDVCSIQARFGDYLTIEGKHILVDEPYLKSAMELVTAETGIIRFKVFSDDLNYFKHNFGHLYNFEYSTNNDILSDLIEISCCHSQIGSSSTFAWWGAYLNRNPMKAVVQQGQWFQQGWSDGNGVVDTSDLLLPEWYIIK